MRNMYTLGIETSCDETACAVLKNDRQILANVVTSSLAKHKAFGGIVPEIASRHCLEAIDYVYQQALDEADIDQNQIDLIAVTRGPGLIGSIFIGVSFAKALSFSIGVPLIGVNHIEAHLEANFISHPKPASFIGLIVSGGHASILCFRRNRYELLGETIDDAIGEAYDKVAKILGLGYPGGPLIDRLAQKGNSKAFSFTKPKQDGKFDFSFSGIKTAVLRLCEQKKFLPPLWGKVRMGVDSEMIPPPLSSPIRHKTRRDSSTPHKNRRLRPPAEKRFGTDCANAFWRTRGEENFVADLCASFQETVIRWIVDKTILACETEKMKNIVVGGGVSANSRLRQLFQEEAGMNRINLLIPPFELTTDNAAMIARLGYSLFKKGKHSEYQMTADPSLRIGEETNERS